MISPKKGRKERSKFIQARNMLKPTNLFSLFLDKRSVTAPREKNGDSWKKIVVKFGQVMGLKLLASSSVIYIIVMIRLYQDKKIKQGDSRKGSGVKFWSNHGFEIGQQLVVKLITRMMIMTIQPI